MTERAKRAYVSLLSLVGLAVLLVGLFTAAYDFMIGLIIAIIIWMGIAQARDKPSWLGILIIIPVVNLIIPGILAFAE